ncbi:MAG: DUF1800 domain-containing protein [Candidatus Kapaibacterium sp.]
MNRRSFLKAQFSGQAETTQAAAGELTKFSGPFTELHAAHLLRRLTFGFPKAKIAEFTALGVDAAVTTLLDTKTNIPKPTVPGTEISWLEFPRDGANDPMYIRYIKAWWTQWLATPNPSILEKMTVFWHNHFVSESEVVYDSRYMYKQNVLFRTNALGNITSLVTAVTKDPAMLRYLNGSTNTNTKPNENYARELLELFTIGKGPEIAPGNYTHYSEQDVQAAARVLTGWSDDEFSATGKFTANRHDSKDKQFSSCFHNAVIKGRTTGGDSEVQDLIAMIFSMEETALFFCRKLYRYFVHYEIDAATEALVIQPLAAILRANNFTVEPVLHALFTSAHFYDPLLIGGMIKNPLDFIIGLVQHFPLGMPWDSLGAYNFYDRYRSIAASLQMELMEHPNVAGWAAYYQAPNFYELWITSATLPNRNGFTDQLVNGFTVSGAKAGIDVLSYVKSVSANPADPYQLIRDIAADLFVFPLTEKQVSSLVTDTLLPGVPDYEWGVIWNEYVKNPTSTQKVNAVKSKLSALLKFMFRMAEFQMM